MSLITPVILCGGSGTRLWPLSRKDRPKPFLPLLSDQTLFQETAARVSDAAIFAEPLVVAGAAHVEQIEAQSSGPQPPQIIVEPAARNTAPAIALAAARLPADAVMLVCPSDHHIPGVDAFRDAARAAANLARQGRLVAFGIAAVSPETGYGYLKRGAALDGGHEIASFVEKPDLERAQAFLSDGNYCWNGGIFAFRAGDFLSELEQHRPDMHRAVLQAVAAGNEENRQFHPDAAAFAAINGESVDYAVMENTANAAMVPADMGWSDIGNWHAIHDASKADDSGNVAQGPAEIADCRNVMIRSDGPRVSAIGLSDIVIVVDGDEVLVTTHEGAQSVGKLKGASQQ